MKRAATAGGDIYVAAVFRLAASAASD